MNSCTTTSTTENFSEYYLLKDISKFSIDNPSPNIPERLWYYDDYLKLLPDLNLYTGSYISRGEILVAHQLVGKSTEAGTLILVHGYNGTSLFTHFQYFAKEFLKRNYRVILLNLPGHEFSGGKRGNIKDFTDYGAMINDFLELTKGQLGKQVILIGHSTGSVAIFDAFANYPEQMKIVNASVLMQAYKDIKNSNILALGAYIIKDVETKYQRLLLLNSIPGNWIIQEKKWSNDIESYKPVKSSPILLIFSGEDEVINTDESMRYFEEVIVNKDIRYYPMQDHVIGKAGYEKVRVDTLNWILSQLDSPIR